MKRMGSIKKIFVKKEEASIGIGAMIVFIAMVLVAAIAASVLIQTANRLETQAMRTGQDTMAEVATGIAVTDVGGHVNNSVIDNVTITVRVRAGSAEVDLNEVAIEITDGVKKCILTYKANAYVEKVGEDGLFNETVAFAVNGTQFGIIKIEDADGSCTADTPVMNRGDYIKLTINTIACFGGLDARDDVWGQVIPEEGSQGMFSFRCPASLTGTIYDLY